MNSYEIKARKTLYLTTGILAGIIMFIMLASFYINNSLLKSDFHKQLFVKYDLYSQTFNEINSSLSDFINNLSKYSPKGVESQSDVLSSIQKSITPEMIKYNLDSIRDGFFQYFSGEKRFLPDIFLNLKQNNDTQAVSKLADTPTNALSRIDKINLSAVLLYINRNDISDNLLVLKMVYYIMNILPGLSMLAVVLLALAALVLCRRFSDIIRWMHLVFITYAALGLLSGIGLYLYAHFMLPGAVSPIAMSLPLNTNTIVSYLQDCIVSPSIFFILSAFIMVALSLFAIPTSKGFYVLAKKWLPFPGKDSQNMRKSVKYPLYALLFLLVIATMGYKVYSLKKEFQSNDFYTVLSKMENISTVTQVIPAKGDTIYQLQVKLVDKKTGRPVPKTELNISGRSSILDSYFNENSLTDETGIAKFTLDKGTFRLSFQSTNFPQEFQMPSPFFFDLKSSGTTIITVNLEGYPELDKQKPGVIEIEVLDSDNNPAGNLELALHEPKAPGQPDNLLSYTNSEGIAVFKVNEGSYKIDFSKHKFPEKYILPDGISVSAMSNTITRYTIRLASVKAPSPSPPKR